MGSEHYDLPLSTLVGPPLALVGGCDSVTEDGGGAGEDNSGETHFGWQKGRREWTMKECGRWLFIRTRVGNENKASVPERRPHHSVSVTGDIYSLIEYCQCIASALWLGPETQEYIQAVSKPEPLTTRKPNRIPPRPAGSRAARRVVHARPD